MVERLVWLPPSWVAPEIKEVMPAQAAALRVLRQHLDVEILRWPSVRGGNPADPTWQAWVETCRRALTPACHVYASTPSVPVALLALSQDPVGVRSLIADHLAIPDATLERIGIGGVAAASAAGYRTALSERWVPTGLRWSSSRAADLADELVDYAYLDQYTRSWESLDLLAESPHLTLPTLYVEWPPHLSQYPEGEPTELFLRFVPGAEVRRTKFWGFGDLANLANPQAGEELAALMIDFLGRLAAGTRLLTVLFTDIVDSTVHALEMGDQRWARVLADHHAVVRKQLKAHGGHEVDNAGDGFLATFESPARAVRCAAAIVDGVQSLGIEVRAGVHTGECEVIGEKVGGVAIHAGARIAASAGPGETLVSQSVRDLVTGSDLEFDSGRTITLKGLPGEWSLYPVATTTL